MNRKSPRIIFHLKQTIIQLSWCKLRVGFYLMWYNSCRKYKACVTLSFLVLHWKSCLEGCLYVKVFTEWLSDGLQSSRDIFACEVHWIGTWQINHYNYSHNHSIYRTNTCPYIMIHINWTRVIRVCYSMTATSVTAMVNWGQKQQRNAHIVKSDNLYACIHTRA